MNEKLTKEEISKYIDINLTDEEIRDICAYTPTLDDNEKKKIIIENSGKCGTIKTSDLKHFLDRINSNKLFYLISHIPTSLNFYVEDNKLQKEPLVVRTTKYEDFDFKYENGYLIYCIVLIPKIKNNPNVPKYLIRAAKLKHKSIFDNNSYKLK